MATKTVPLHGAKAVGRVVLVDETDYELVSAYRWNVWERQRPGGRTWGPYARTNITRDGRQRGVLMHKLITGWPRTDPVNHDGLDNRRENMRPATAAGNTRNQRPQTGHSSRYKGVTWLADTRKWQASIKVDGRCRYLGSFAVEEDAAAAYDAAAAEAYGSYAYLNLGRAA